MDVMITCAWVEDRLQDDVHEIWAWKRTCDSLDLILTGRERGDIVRSELIPFWVVHVPYDYIWTTVCAYRADDVYVWHLWVVLHASEPKVLLPRETTVCKKNAQNNTKTGPQAKPTVLETDCAHHWPLKRCLEVRAFLTSRIHGHQFSKVTLTNFPPPRTSEHLRGKPSGIRDEVHSSPGSTIQTKSVAGPFCCFEHLRNLPDLKIPLQYDLIL